MPQHLAHIALLVDDYDRAIAWFSEKLRFELIEDTPMSAVKRWVLMRPQGSDGCMILLAKAASPEQLAVVGHQGGGRVFLFLHTDDLMRDHAHMRAHGVEFVRPPEVQPWGRVAVFRDLFGNLWDLIEPR